jgi:CheY-like chemotaxis protein
VNEKQIKLLTDIDNGKPMISILIVDDDAFNLFSLRQLILSIGNYHVDTAMNGRKAIKKVQ